MRKFKVVVLTVLIASLVFSSLTGCKKQETVKVGDYSNIRISESDLSGASYDIDTQVKQMKYNIISKYANKTVLYSGKIQDGDEIQFTSKCYYTVDGTQYTVKELTLDTQNYVAGSGYYDKEVEKLISSLSVYGEGSVKYKIPNTSVAASDVGREVTFEVKIVSAYRYSTTIINQDIIDKYCKDSGIDSMSIDSFNTYLSDNVKDFYEKYKESLIESAAYNYVLKRSIVYGIYKYDVDRVYKQNIEYVKEQYNYLIANDKDFDFDSFDDYLVNGLNYSKGEEDLENASETTAQLMVVQGYILKYIAEKEKITSNAEDSVKYLEESNSLSKADAESFYDSLDTNAKKNVDMLSLYGKVKSWLADRTEILNTSDYSKSQTEIEKDIPTSDVNTQIYDSAYSYKDIIYIALVVFVAMLIGTVAVEFIRRTFKNKTKVVKDTESDKETQ